MVEKESMPINVIGCPISREVSGLAMSSRNERLSVEDKEKAAFVYKTLQEARQLFANESIANVKKHVYDAFLTHPEFKMDYFEITAEDDLVPANTKENKKYRGFIAVFLSNVRLIDNISLN
jgi:pantoate--beta-alanine ligase